MAETEYIDGTNGVTTECYLREFSARRAAEARVAHLEGALREIVKRPRDWAHDLAQHALRGQDGPTRCPKCGTTPVYDPCPGCQVGTKGEQQ